jgi:HAD superfamily hydrolase (TIGR01509 family)
MLKNIVFDFYGVLLDTVKDTVDNEMLEICASLKRRGFSLNIFTNTSFDHIHSVEEKHDFLKFFDNVISCTEKQKPSKESFNSLLNILSCNPNEILFVDDSEKNISVAKEFGIIGIIFTNIEDLKLKLSEKLNDN